jgi:tRNA/tmRNA/rRNA uracil-C5-methylase (TrmA/RlmC/RlmD family)
MFALAHFKPFSFRQALLGKGESFDEAFARFEFSSFNCCILDNWEALHESEDERDAERLRKQLVAQKAAKALTRTMKTIDSTDLLEIDECSSAYNNTRIIDSKVQTLLQSLTVSEWLHPKSNQDIARVQVTTKSFSPSTIRDLQKQLKTDGESYLRLKRTAAATPTPSLSLGDHHIPESIDGESSTELLHSIENSKSTTSEAILAQVSAEWKLNEKQNIAFKIIARSYFDVLQARANKVPKKISLN